MKNASQLVRGPEPVRPQLRLVSSKDPATPVVFAAQGAFGFLLAGLGPCLILLSRDLNTPRESLSWVSSGFGVGLLLLGATGERLLRMGGWRLNQLSAGVQVMGAALLALAPDLQLARAGALLLGLGGAGMVLATPVLLAGPGATARMSRAFGLSSLLGIASPLLLSATDAITRHGRWALLIPLPALLWVAMRHAAPSPVPHAEPAPHPAGSADRGAIWKALRWWLGIVAAVSPEFAFVVWGAARLQDSGLSPAAAAAAATAFPVGMALGRLVVLPRLLGRFPLVPAGVALAAVAALACAAPLPPALVALAIVLAGLGISPLYPLTIDRLVHTPGLDPRWGSAVGALGSGTAIIAAPFLLIALARVVSLRLAFVAVVPLLVLVVIIHARAPRAEAGH